MKKKQKFPVIDELLVRMLENLYPPLEYNPDETQESWAFRGGQRDVVSKLRFIYEQQKKGEYYG
tara:strand:+ start:592 stop:783 length:192 start_codon:yes stop_codon:yes gene_type:complete